MTSSRPPLATLHKFNGWADKFLATPDAGLEDTYVSLGADLHGAKALAVFHSFEADVGGMDFGSELDVSLTYAVSKSVGVGLKYADYDADKLFTDTEKIWGWLSFTP